MELLVIGFALILAMLVGACRPAPSTLSRVEEVATPNIPVRWE